MELQGFSATQKQAHPVYCLFIHFSFQVNKSRILLWQRMSGETPSYFYQCVVIISIKTVY